ncbi:hypothetical protein QAD02_020504 [Eretmocerus hayati]|uniref:Uncharacterized protein n=1 Tax=Eretmocerus hayati TaxID=131215 RepID=A0ACC2PMM0_9HYME|nr:hypothetical protein QAD02_020504 [Eretmocerus hayati]
MNDYIENRMVRNVRGNLVKPSLNEVTSWVRKAWDKINEKTVKNSLRAAYLDKSCPFGDTAIAKHDRIGPMLLAKLRSGDLSQNAPEPDNVPELDDVSVILE